MLKTPIMIESTRNSASPLHFFTFITQLKSHLQNSGHQEVITPPVVSNPGMEPHIHPFKVVSTLPAYKEKVLGYLHTSPEFSMKMLLSQGMPSIYTLNYVYRDEPNSPIHRPQFLMLEWYTLAKDLTPQQTQQKISDTLFNFYSHYLNTAPSDYIHQKFRSLITDKNQFAQKIISIPDVMKKIIGIDILDCLEVTQIHAWIKTNRPSYLSSNDETAILPWEDYFFLLYLNEIEPLWANDPFVIVTDFPAPLAALSELNKNDPRLCLRFEIYSFGIEIGNCYYELRNIQEQRERFKKDAEKKKTIYHYTLPECHEFYNALERGIPPCAGIAIGIERLYQVLSGQENIFWEHFFKK